MIDMKTVAEEVKNIAEKVSPRRLSKVHAYLVSLLHEDGSVSERPYDIAVKILSLDKPQRFTKLQIEFIVWLLQLEIREGNDTAMNDLGAAYYDGRRGFPQNYELAMQYYKMAAAKGNRVAQENLGYCYYYGRDGKRDYEKAFHYFALGAFDGHLISLYKIGDMYLNGYFVEKNEKEAFYIFMRCLDTMTDEAAPRVAGPLFLRLGKMFSEGRGTEKDPQAALSCYQKAENYLFDMVMAGDEMYRKSLDGAVAGQAAAREELRKILPERRRFGIS